MKTEYVVTQEGSIIRRSTEEKELEMTDAIITQLGSSAKRSVQNLFEVDGHNCGLTITSNGTLAQLTIPFITLTSPFRMVGEVMVPSFVPNQNDPVLTLNWSHVGPNADMRIIFAVWCTLQNEFSVAYLFAYDKKGNAYRLPLPNLHDDARLCLGTFSAKGKTVAEIVFKCLRQFQASQWNTDLLKNLEASQKLLRWRPNNEQFEVLPPQEPWPSLCTKIATGVTELVIL